MAKKVYIATAPDGSAFQRKTDRTYAAAVLGQRSKAWEMSQCDRDWDVDGKNWEFAGQMVAWGGIFRGERQTWDTDEKIAKDLAKYTAQMNEYPDRAAAVAGKRAERVAGIQRQDQAGAFQEWQLLGFCGRQDLAAKLMASKAGPWENMVIAPAILKA